MNGSIGGSRQGFSAGTSHAGFGGDASEDGDGAWVSQNGSSGGPEFIPTSSSENMPSRVRSTSDSSQASTTTMASVASSGWGDFQRAPRPTRTTARSNNGGSNAGFAKQGAEWREEQRKRDLRSAAEARNREREEEERKKIHLPVDDDDDDDDDDEDDDAPY